MKRASFRSMAGRRSEVAYAIGWANLAGIGMAMPTSRELRIVELLRRTNDDTIDYELLVDDPLVLTSTWKAAYPLKRDETYRFFEYACHEDNHTIRDFINASRAERAALAGR